MPGPFLRLGEQIKFCATLNVNEVPVGFVRVDSYNSRQLCVGFAYF